MKRTMAFGVLALLASGAHAQRPPCVRDGSQSEMVSCAGDDAAAAEKALDHVYGALQACASGDPLFLDRLRTSQGLWERFLDAEIEAYQPVDEAAGEVSSVKWGSMYPLTYLIVKKTLVEERTAQLRRFFQEHFLAEQCAASPAARNTENPHAED